MSSILKVDQLQDSGGNNLVTSNGSGVITAAGFGKVGQVLQTVKTDTFTSTSTSFTDITGLSVSITPSSTSSKILVMAHVMGHGQNASNHGLFRLLRNSTVVYAGDTAGSRASGFGDSITSDVNSQQANVAIYLDSPSSTSSITYKIQGGTEAGTFYVNRSPNDSDSFARGRTASSILVQEILP
jgi:hypothetical protein